MVRKNFSCDLSFHVFTEKKRFVPDHMIRHNLQDWPGISGAKKAWWYKLQMFNPEHFSGRLLYLDLDVVITRNLDWMLSLDKNLFWTIRDFKYLWRPTWKGMNSSVMLWDTTKWAKIWDEFQNRDLAATVRKFHGDQDFLNSLMNEKHLRFFDEKYTKSWRWQIKDGGFDMKTRVYNQPNAGSIIDSDTAVIVFHGSPKPHEIQDPLIQKLWNNH
jgi:lipopolysaccharide biosynthesis glycosyltransferase